MDSVCSVFFSFSDEKNPSSHPFSFKIFPASTSFPEWKFKADQSLLGHEGKFLVAKCTCCWHHICYLPLNPSSFPFSKRHYWLNPSCSRRARSWSGMAVLYPDTAVLPMDGGICPLVSRCLLCGAGSLGERSPAAWSPLRAVYGAGSTARGHRQTLPPGPCVPVSSNDKSCNSCGIIWHFTNLFLK